MRLITSLERASARVIFASLSAAILSACGGSDPVTSVPAPATAATQSYALNVTGSTAAPSGVAQPTFHLAPVFLDEPDEADRSEPSRSAAMAPRRVALNPAFGQLSTRRLTPQILEQFRDTGMAPESAMAEATSANPLATAATVTVYTPAQIRAAYGLPALPSVTSSVTSAQGAQLGAGQTIYIVDAQSDPNVAAELASFDSKFGLPGCTVTPISTTASLPLSPAPVSGCQFSIVYSTTSGGMAATAPSYNSSWAMEIALDVEWSHATAPFARIVLIEAPDSSVTSLAAAVQLANQMGPGVVSQSFGAAEGGWVTSLDATYSVAYMTYLAAAGDAGEQVNWPAVSSHVLAVSGTSLSYTGTAPRTETVWPGTGGGAMSAYVATPAYQTTAVPGLNAPTHRAVSDVTFNADPNTGQYTAIAPQNSGSINWYSIGGTSLSTPQWAGIVAVANALRAQASLKPIGAAQATLYNIAAQATSYAGSFLDVTKGSDGNCTTCNAGVGYDLPSGLGSPNVQSLLTALVAQPAVSAPVVTPASVSGKVGTALSFAITATSAHVLTYTLTGAPAGMTVNAGTGIITWSAPIVGTYAVIAHALDAYSGLSGQATVSVSVSPATPPLVSSGSVSGTAQTALNFVVQVTDANVVNITLSGAPSGMSVSTAGVVSWASPVVGTYPVTVTARDTSTGMSGQGLLTVTIFPPQAPTVSSGNLNYTVGKSIAYCVNANGTHPLTYSLKGAPSGMVIGSTGCITWTAPILGTYPVAVTVQDSVTKLTAIGQDIFAILAPGPSITTTHLAGVAGKALTGTIAFADSSSSALSVTINGVPAGMSFTVSGSGLTGDVLTAKWNSPVTGTYLLQVTVTDSQKLTATATIPVTITAH